MSASQASPPRGLGYTNVEYPSLSSFHLKKKFRTKVYYFMTPPLSHNEPDIKLHLHGVNMAKKIKINTVPDLRFEENCRKILD